MSMNSRGRREAAKQRQTAKWRWMMRGASTFKCTDYKSICMTNCRPATEWHLQWKYYEVEEGLVDPFPTLLWRKKSILVSTIIWKQENKTKFHIRLFANNCLRCCQSPPIDVPWKEISIIDFPCKLPSAFASIVVFWQTGGQWTALSSLVTVTVCCLPFALIANRKMMTMISYPKGQDQEDECRRLIMRRWNV